MIKRKLFYIYILCLIFFPTCLEAQEDENDVEEVVITAERIHEEETKDQTAFVTVIKADDFKDRVTSVPELLNQSVGINVKQYGGLGSFSTISIRGSSSEQVAIFLDGVLLNQARSGVVNLADIPLDNVERIEVYRGTSPAKFGGSGIGGVVNIITKRFKESSYHNINYSYGSFNTHKSNILLSRNRDKLRSMIFFNHMSSDGDFEFYDDNGTPNNPDDDEKTHRKNNDFNSYNLLAKAGYELSPGLELSLSNNLFWKHQGIPGISSSQSRKSNLETLRNLAQFKLRKEGFSIPLDLELLLSFNFQRQRFEDRKGEIGLGRQDNKEDTFNYAGHVLLTYHLWDFQIINLFFQLKKEKYGSINHLAGTSASGLQKEDQDQIFYKWTSFWLDWLTNGKEGGGDNLQEDNLKGKYKSNINKRLRDQHRTTYTISLEDELFLLSDRLIITPSLRYDYYYNDFKGKGAFPASPGGGDDPSDGLLSRKVGVKLRLTDYLSCKGNIGKYYRIPNFSELFGDRGYIVGNRNLDPEEGINWDIGLSLRMHDIWHLKELFFEYSYFKSNVDDIIIFVQNSQRTSIAMNIAEAEIKGHEFSWFINWGNWINLSGNYTIQDARDRGNIPYWRNNKLPNRPEYELFNRIELYNRYGKIFYEYTCMGENYWDRANRAKVSRREIHNLGLSIFLPCNVTFTFEVKNLTDDWFEDVRGYPLPGRSYFTTIAWSF